jgi:stage II sporulation protein D
MRLIQLTLKLHCLILQKNKRAFSPAGNIGNSSNYSQKPTGVKAGVKAGVKMDRLVKFCLIALIIIMFTLPVQAEQNKKLRVRLSNNSQTAVFQVIYGSYYLRDFATNFIIAKLNSGDMVSVYQAGQNLIIDINGKQDEISYSGPLLAEPENDVGLNVFSLGNNYYRDGISIEVYNSKLLVVNRINVDHYLYGVVGKEIGYSAPAEALKAQAIVCRSYAMSYDGSGLKYDLGSDSGSQVYEGYSAEQSPGAEKIIKTVNETAGKIICYYNKNTKNKEIVKAFFHSNAGGYTENSENVWYEAIPYLRAVASPYDKYAEELSQKTGQSYPGNTYKWKKTLTYDQVVQAIKQYLQKNAPSVNFGDFIELKLHKVNKIDGTPSASGRVTKMELVGSKGAYTVNNDSIRAVFNLNSTKFEVTANNDSMFTLMDSSGIKNKVKDINSLMVIQGDKDVVSLSGSVTDYQVLGRLGTANLTGKAKFLTFSGYGYGHGIGMSQWGAIGMAEKGYNYGEIIEHYYNQGKNDGLLTIENL